MSEGADFTINLVNQVTGPALAVTQQMRAIKNTFEETKRVIEAPASRTGGLSDWQKMVSKARLSQIKDFSKSRAAAMKPPVPTTTPESSSGGLLATLGGVVSGTAIVEVLNTIGEAALGAVVGVAKLGAEFMHTALESAAFVESSTKAIGYLTDNVAHAGTVFNDVRHLAQQLGFGVEDTVHSFQKLLAAQFTVGQSKDLIKMSADMRAIGASAEEVQRIIYAMTEIKSIGTLQKRQERMLQMAGISGELIDKALMARTGIKTKGGIDLARKKNLIDADTAIEAIKDAVMSKTHEQALGQVGKDRADTQLQGMIDKFKAGVSNFWDDIGDAMVPGATRLAKLIAGTLGRLADDPKIGAFGEFMLAKWEKFTNFLQANWPTVEKVVVGGIHAIIAVIEFASNIVENHKSVWQAVAIVVLGFAATLAAVAAAVAIVVIDLAVQLGVLGAAAMAIGTALGAGLALLENQAKKWYNAGKNLVDSLIRGILSGLGPVGNAIAGVAAIVGLAIPAGGGNPPGPQNPAVAALGPVGTRAKPLELAPDPEVLLSTLATGSVNGINIDHVFKNVPDKTEAGKPTGTHSVNVGEMILHVTSAAGDDPNATGAKIGAVVRAELQKMLKG